MATLVINGQTYIIEQGAGGYTYYRLSQSQRFGKKVKSRNGTLAIFSGTDGTPNPEIGLQASNLSWGTGSDYPPAEIVYPPVVFTDISTASLAASKEFDIHISSGWPSDMSGLFFKPDGTKVWTQSIYSGSSSKVKEWELTTAWDITTLQEPELSEFSLGISTEETGIWWHPDGTYIFISYATSSYQKINVRRYPVSTPWDLSTIGAYDKTMQTPDSWIFARRMSITADGTIMHLGHNSGFLQYTMSTPWDLSTATRDYAESNAGKWSANLGWYFNSDGTQLVKPKQAIGIEVWDLSTPWDVTTGVLQANKFVQDLDNCFITPDGTKMYCNNQATYRGLDIQQYNTNI